MTSRQQQRGYLLVSVVVALFLLATVAVLLSHGSAINANSATSELGASRAEYVTQAGMQHALWRTRNNACMGDIIIPETALGDDSYMATVTGASPGTAYVLSADQDAWVRSDDTDKNNGTTATNHVRQENGKVEQVLTRFDLSALPADAQINSAVAWFHLEAGKDHPEGPIDVFEIIADWEETSVTWESLGEAYRKVSMGMIPAQDTGDVWVTINLTGLVQGWVNGQPNNGILFHSLAEGLHTEYTSREDGANPPRLEVVVGSGPASPVFIEATGLLGDGATRTLANAQAVAYQPPGLTVIQPGIEGNDGGARAAQATSNYGAAVEVTVSGGGSPDHFLIQFPINGIPAGSRIVSARMEMYLNWLASSDPAAQFSVHRMTEAWAEGSGDNWNPGDGANWDTSDGNQSWDWQSNHDAAVATTVVDPSYSGWHSWDIAELVGQWLTGEMPNYGVVIKGNANAQDAWFRTSDYADPAYHPRLIVEYACECGDPCMPPRGSGTILLVRNKNNPTSIDTENQARLESWGYAVNLIDDWAYQSEYNTAFANNDVVFISGASPYAVGSKLTNAPIGVVNSRGELNDELGIASGYSSPVSSQLDVVDNSHYITAVVPTGTTEIYELHMAGLAISGGAPTGAHELGSWGGNSAIVALDEGGDLSGGGNAAGRRVLLPIGATMPVDWRYVTNTGELLLQRSIDWAMGADIAPPTNSLLMVVVNPNNLTSQESIKKGLIETWGFAVNLIDESADPAKFDQEFASNDVVYVTEDVTASNVNTKLTDAPIGVVTEEANLVDDLQLGSGIGWDSSIKTAILTNNHYITQPFSVGSIALFTTTESLAYQTPTLAPDLVQLGRSDSGPGVTAVEASTELLSGNPAAGRRVLLPWGGNNMDINHLSNDGLTIFRRAIEWAAGANLTGPMAHWKLDETSGATAVDSVGGHDGTLLSGPAWTPGQLAGGLEFDGSDDYVDLTADAELTDIFAAGATVTGWIHPHSWGESNNGRILDKANQVSGDRDGWMIALRGDTPAVQFAQGFTGVRGFWRSEAGTVPLNSWTHFAVVYDASSVANDAEIYLNGVKQSPLVEITPTGTIATDSGIALRMGNYAQDTSRTFDGIIDDVRIYDRMLSSGEIAELAAPPPVVPLAHWELDETSGLTAVDSIGGHDGTLTNGPSWTSGTIDGGLSFDGSNDRVNVPHDSGLDLVSRMTISAWINAATLKPFQMVLTKGDSGVPENYWLATESDKLNFGFVDSGLYAQYTSSGLTLQADTWHHVAATFDNAAKEVVLYVDGSSETFSSTYTPAPNSERLIIGSSYYGGEAFDGVLDDVRLYDRVLSASEIAALAGAGGGGGGGGGGAQYIEIDELLWPNDADTWETVGLSSYGVPADAVVEIAVMNNDGGRENWVGARAVGSNLERRFRLHESEGGGYDVVTMHVQTNANSQIQTYADRTNSIAFRLLGYWIGASYVELFQPFSADASNSWVAEDVSNDGLGPNQVAEIVMQNNNQSAERLAGVRASGSSNQRRFNLHEAESGGVDAYSMMVETDASSTLEVFAQSSSNIQFVAVGYWSTPPGTYVENGVGQWTASSTSWETVDLSAAGVPPNSVAQITFGNFNQSSERMLGVRSVGSSLDRRIDLQEAESGGNDRVTCHVRVDGNGNIQSYAESSGTNYRFAPVGWWVLN